MFLVVRFEPAALEVAVTPGGWVIDAPGGGLAAGLPLSCRAASCGVCRVAVEAGAELLEPADATERLVLDALRATSDERLGCQLRLIAPAPASAAVPAVRLRVITPALPGEARSGSAG